MRRGLLLTVAAATIAFAMPAHAMAAPQVFFLQGDQAVPVKRANAKTVRTVVTALLAGPTAPERAKRVKSYIPARTTLRAATLNAASGVATVDMSERFAAGTKVEDLHARLTQLVLTVGSVPGVRSVQVLVIGGYPIGLFPGYDLTKPITVADVRKPAVPPPTAPTVQPGDASEATRLLQQRLVDLGYLPTNAVDGRMGQQTTNAVIAFQKWQKLGRDGDPGPATTAALATASRPTPRTAGSARRVEVLLDRQLVLLVEGSTVLRTIHISSGAPATATPPGTYKIFRKEQRSWSVPFRVWLPWASYFVGGIAFHEYPDIPVQAASHGCVRVPREDAPTVYDFTPIGTPVHVLTRS